MPATHTRSSAGRRAIGCGVFSGVDQSELTKALLEPRIQTFLAAAIDQLLEHAVDQRLKTIRVPDGGAAQCIPDVCELAVLDAVEADVAHSREHSAQRSQP